MEGGNRGTGNGETEEQGNRETEEQGNRETGKVKNCVSTTLCVE
jgi:hypothetical protein